MNFSPIDYKKLYHLQDKVLKVLKGNLGDFYLTGGTALGRFFLDHRYSEDLDFFVNRHADFLQETNRIFQYLKKYFRIDEPSTLQTTDFVRIWLEDEIRMKIEFVNDVPDRWGKSLDNGITILDNPANILANKIGAMLNREEAKDVFDIVTIAEIYSFNWSEVYFQAIKKQLMNEPDIMMRLSTFPVEWLKDSIWLKYPVDPVEFKQKLEIICDDFLLAQDNSLGKGKVHITEAVPVG